MKPMIAVILHTGVNQNNYFSHIQPVGYSEAIEVAGGVPYLVPFTEHLELIDQMLAPAHALLFPGGMDICPYRYGEKKEEECGETEDKLDDYQFRAFEIGMSKHLPILGICRGHQVINVGLGGTLYQDIVKSVKGMPETLKKHADPDPQKENLHTVYLEKNSQLFELFGERIITNSHHHQAVKQLGQGLRVTARTDDGVIESMEHETLPIMSVQWHPETMMDAEHNRKMLPLFQWLVEKSSLKLV